MKGIYLIRNTINGKEYVGQTNNIELRFQQHRSNDKKYSDEFHKDIQQYGKENFEYIVLEQFDDDCDREYMLEREKYHIRVRNASYNLRGKADDFELRKRISEGTKQWWDNLPDEAKEKVIKNNLKGPRKGHEVSEETRQKIRENENCRHYKRVRIVETGEEFKGVTELEKHLGACEGTYAAYKKGKIKTVKGFHIEEV